MAATLLDLPVETPETSVSCANCPAVQRLERALEELRADFRREVGYWKSRHADGQQRFGESGTRPGGGAEKLLRLRFVVEWPAGSGDVFAVGHAGPLETQSATVADVVLGKLRGGRREGA